MFRFFISLSFLLLALSNSYSQQTARIKYRYLENFDFKDTALCRLSGPARIISSGGRMGLNTSSIHSVLKLNAPFFNSSAWERQFL